MKKIYFLLIVLLQLLYSCNQQESENYSVLQKNNVERYIERSSNILGKNDACKVGALFTGNDIETRSSSYEIIEIDDSISKLPLLYIINYGNNNGYIIISASKNMPPILAYSDKENFSLTADNPASIFINEYRKTAKKAILCTSDSLRIKFALQWAAFEKAEKEPISRASSTEITKKIEKEIAYRESLGYKHIGGITTARYYMSEADYQAFLKNMESCSDPQYNYMETVQLFMKTETKVCIEELMQTKWHQGYPFNVDAPNGYAGCVPIAIAQIIYFHKYPSKYDWNQIYISPSLNSAFSFFIKDIRHLACVEYLDNGTSSNIKKAKSALESLGYIVRQESTPTEDKLSTQIVQHNPVYVRGTNLKGTGHAWVCDGYKYSQDIAIATFIPKPKDHRFDMEDKSENGFVAYRLTIDQNAASLGKFFHMNLGWGGISNGWYRYNTNISTEDYNFKNNQAMLTIQK